MPFHGDETALIFMGKDNHLVFANGELPVIKFDREDAKTSLDTQLRLLDGTISKTIYGWVTTSNGLSSDDLNGTWIWTEDYDSNVTAGNMSKSEILRQTRLASAAQLAIAVALFFLFARMTLNQPTAYVASALFALHPNVLINGRRTMMEGSHLLGLTLVLLAGAWLIRKRAWWSYALLGVCTGFAIAAKHTNALPAATVFCACFALHISLCWRERDSRWRTLVKSALGMTLAALVAVLIFLSLNPVWLSAPLEVAPAVIEMRQDQLRRQVEYFGGYNSFAEQISGFFQYVFVGERQYLEAASRAQFDVVSAQIGEYEHSGLAGLLFIGESAWLGLISLLLAVAGLASLARSASVTAEHKTLLLVWIVGSALFTLIVTPLPWARYYLPLIPAIIVLVSYALVTIVAAIWKRIKPQSHGVALND